MDNEVESNKEKNGITRPQKGVSVSVFQKFFMDSPQTNITAKIWNTSC
jgi:hypothetical protein